MACVYKQRGRAREELKQEQHSRGGLCEVTDEVSDSKIKNQRFEEEALCAWSSGASGYWSSCTSFLEMHCGICSASLS